MSEERKAPGEISLREHIQNAAKPEGDVGRSLLEQMNEGVHAQLAEFGFAFLSGIKPDDCVLDIGCGGGANVARWLEYCPDGKVFGVDYAAVSLEMTTDFNKQAIEEGRCEVLEGEAGDLPFDDETFDFISAFETVYFWPSIEDCFLEVFRVLKQGGEFLICNESDGSGEKGKEMEAASPKMHVYDDETLDKLLTEAGFENIEIYYGDEAPWLAVTAEKPIEDRRHLL